MISWEYNTIVFQGDMPSAIPYLDQDGKEGWEVVGFSHSDYSGGTTYLLKRPVPVQVGVVQDASVKHGHSVRFMCNNHCPQYGTINEITS